MWNEGPIGGFRKWRNEEAIPTYAELFLGEVTVGEIFREGVPAAREQAIENLVIKTAIRQEQGSSFGYAFFQSAIGDPILGGVGVLPIMESWKGYNSLTGEDISTADRLEQAGMGVFRVGATGALLSTAYNPGLTSFKLAPVTNLGYTGTGFAGAREWATTYRSLGLNREWLTTFRVNNNTPIIWTAGKAKWTPHHGFQMPAADKGRFLGDAGNSPFALSDDAAAAMGLPRGATVPWREGIPDFSAYAVPGPAGVPSTFSVAGLTGAHGADRTLMLQKLAAQSGMSQRALKQWLAAKNVRLHHAGGEAVQIVPAPIHSLHHTGGAQQLRGGN